MKLDFHVTNHLTGADPIRGILVFYPACCFECICLCFNPVQAGLPLTNIRTHVFLCSICQEPIST